jgi:methionyl-tRNA formyltransferase
MFLGQGPLAEFAYARLLEAAEEADLRVLVACSNVAAESTWWGTAGISELASRHATTFVSNEHRNESALVDSAADSCINCIISVGHPWILPARLLRSTAGVVAFNLHNGPLPRFGGFNTGSHAILEGVTHFGATLHWMDPVPDGGPIACEEGFEIPPDATAKALHSLTLTAGQHLFIRLVDFLSKGQLPPHVAMGGPPRIYPRNALAAHREIRDVCDAVEVDRKSRAFWFPPFEPAFYCVNDKKFYVVPEFGLEDITALG